jgi:hypothetical protein
MRLSSILKYFRRLLIPASLGIVRMGGCASIPLSTTDAVQTQSCMAGAQAVRFTMTYSDATVGLPHFFAGSLNLDGVPTVVDLGGAYQVTAKLHPVALGEVVQMVFEAVCLGFGGPAEVSGVEFFAVPPDDIPGPSCKEGVSPAFALVDHALYGAVLQASNPATQPLALSTLQLVESPTVLDPSILDWSNSTFNALPWQNAINGTAILDPAGQPLVVDLPEQTLPGTQAVLCRFVCFDQGMEFRGIVQASLTGGSVATRPTTWGAVKALYRRE